MNPALKARTERIARQLRDEYSRLDQQDPDHTDEKLKEFLSSILAKESSTDAMAILEELCSLFPSITHERDEETERKQKQLEVLQDEVLDLSSRLDNFTRRGEWSAELGTEIVPAVLRLIYGEEANLTHLLANRAADYSKRMSDSVRMLLAFVHDFSGRFSHALHAVGAEKQDADLFTIIKQRLAADQDPGTAPLEEYLERLLRKLPILLAAHQTAAIEGSLKLLIELSPETIEKKAQSTRSKQKWHKYEEIHSKISSYTKNKLYRQYFDAAFRKTIAEEDQ